MSDALSRLVRVSCKCGNSYTASMLTETEPRPCPACQFENGYTWATLEDIEKMEFADFKREVDAIARKHCFIGIDDFTSDEFMQSALDSGFTPLEYVQHMAEKYDFDFVDENTPLWLR